MIIIIIPTSDLIFVWIFLYCQGASCFESVFHPYIHHYLMKLWAFLEVQSGWRREFYFGLI